MQVKKKEKKKYFSIGAVKLKDWYFTNKIKQIDIPIKFGVSRQQFNFWLHGGSRPNLKRRKLIEKLIGIKESDWFKGEER